MLDRLDPIQTRAEHPDRFNKVDLLAASIRTRSPGRYIVERADDDASAHDSRMVETFGLTWGYCSCDGYEYNDGPCSHLCALFRANQQNFITLPTARVTAIQADTINDQAARADHYAEPEETPEVVIGD